MSMPYRLRDTRSHHGLVDKRSEAAQNQALAAAMKKLMAGRSIQTLRAQMAERGLKIGGGTLHRAVKGEVGNRLESLEKIAQFFDTTVDQLLQFDGIDETYWPFSAELQQRVIALSDEELYFAENSLRAHLRMQPLSSPSITPLAANGVDERTADVHHRKKEEVPGALEQEAVPGQLSNGNQVYQRSAHPKGGRRG